MQKRTREILALLLLVVLVLVGVGAMAYYIFIGHNWNVAASNIDDRIGQMDGYTVVLYDGTRPLDADEPEDGKAPAPENGDAPALEGDQAFAPEDGDAPAPEDGGAPAPEGGEAPAPEGNQAPAPDGAGDEGDAPALPEGEREEAAVGDGGQAVQETAGQASGSPAGGSAGTADPEGSSQAGEDDDHVDLKSVVESYREKGARVFVVDAADPSRYTEPFVVAKDGMRVGFMAVGKAERRSAARADALYLSEREVNYTIAITNDTGLDAAVEDGLVGDISIIVCDDPEGDFPDGRYCGSAFCVRTPYVGEVGAVLVSPSGVLSSKTIDRWRDI